MLNDKRILITGGHGFLGAAVNRQLRRQYLRAAVICPRHSEFDLRRLDDVNRLYRETTPNIVIHCAAAAGGIGANRDTPGSFFYDNLVMGAHLMEGARQHGVEKFVAIGTVCAYPKVTALPFKEENLWNGYPEETNAPYGLAKKMLLVQAQAYREQYGFNAIYLLLANLYGPGDNFDAQTSHVIPAIIRKCEQAMHYRSDSITLWGTGNPTREFLYVEDAARAITLATERYNAPTPVNVGDGVEIRIRTLATMIADRMGYRGEIIFDATYPDGQPRRVLATDKAERLFGFRAQTPFVIGLDRTIEWYLSTVRQAVHAR